MPIFIKCESGVGWKDKSYVVCSGCGIIYVSFLHLFIEGGGGSLVCGIRLLVKFQDSRLRASPLWFRGGGGSNSQSLLRSGHQIHHGLSSEHTVTPGLGY